MSDFILIEKPDFDAINACIRQLEKTLNKPKECIMTIEAVAEFLNVEVPTAKKYVERFNVPVSVLSEKTKRYKESDIIEKIFNANILKTK